MCVCVLACARAGTCLREKQRTKIHKASHSAAALSKVPKKRIILKSLIFAKCLLKHNPDPDHECGWTWFGLVDL